MIKDIFQSIDELYDETVKIRRYLHQHPELSFKEFETAKYIANFYEKLGLPYQTDVGGNGVIATLKGGKEGKTIALRADFDALPIQDAKDVPYKSTVDGVMHACGHDGHTATLLTIAKALLPFQEQIPGTVVFLHQHAEEIAPGGAKPIVESGALDHVDAFFGTHLWGTTPTGIIQTSQKELMAGSDRFEITIHGEGGHGAAPHETKDAIVIGTELVQQLQQIVSRKIDPVKTAVVTVGEFNAGSSFNVIASEANIVGTVRYLDEAVQKDIIEKMERMIQGICHSHDVTYTLDYLKGYPPVINHQTEAQTVIDAAQSIEEVKDVEEIVPIMGGEDFSYYILDRPGAYFFTGAKKDGYPHHHPKFDFDETAMPIAAKTLIKAYFNYQQLNT